MNSVARRRNIPNDIRERRDQASVFDPLLHFFPEKATIQPLPTPPANQTSQFGALGFALRGNERSRPIPKTPFRQTQHYHVRGERRVCLHRCFAAFAVKVQQTFGDDFFPGGGIAAKKNSTIGLQTNLKRRTSCPQLAYIVMPENGPNRTLARLPNFAGSLNSKHKASVCQAASARTIHASDQSKPWQPRTVVHRSVATGPIRSGTTVAGARKGETRGIGRLGNDGQLCFLPMPTKRAAQPCLRNPRQRGSAFPSADRSPRRGRVGPTSTWWSVREAVAHLPPFRLLGRV